MNGKVVKLVSDKGFGFIKPRDGGEAPDIFFHATGMVDRTVFDELEIEDAVTYEIDNSRDRPRACEIARV